jgi:HD domain
LKPSLIFTRLVLFLYQSDENQDFTTLEISSRTRGSLVNCDFILAHLVSTCWQTTVYAQIRYTRVVIGRFFRLARALSPRFANPDDHWARTILSAAEFDVYARMDARDREHAIRVTKKLLGLYPDSSLILQRATLLHDCGKSLRPYNVFERVMVGLFYRVDAQATESVGFEYLSASEVKKHHPQLGSKLILEAGGDARVAEIVAKHHAPGSDPDAKRVHEVDELE